VPLGKLSDLQQRILIALSDIRPAWTLMIDPRPVDWVWIDLDPRRV
jgi:hypothetical protein